MPPLPAMPDRRAGAEVTSAPIRYAPAELPVGPSIFAAEPTADYDRQRAEDVRSNPSEDAITMPTVNSPRPADLRAVPLTAAAPAPPTPSAPPRTAPEADLSAPLYSTRIDPRLYASSGTTHGELPLADTQVDDEGREVHVIYHRDGRDAQPA